MGASADVDKSTWLAHPYTQSQAQVTQKESEKALVNLLAVCSKSIDPKVCQMFGVYDRFTSMTRVLRGGK